MKKLIIVGVVALTALFAAASCAKIEEPADPSEETKIEESEGGDFVVKFECSMPEEEGTKTSFNEDKSKISWVVGDKIRFCQYAYITDGYSVSPFPRTLSEDNLHESGQTKVFATSNFANPTIDVNKKGYYYSIYPNEQYGASSFSSGVMFCRLTLLSDQMPQAMASYDPLADLLISELQVVETKPTSIQLRYTHAVAFGKMTIKNLPSSQPVKTIEFSAKAGENNVPVAGTKYYSINDGVGVDLTTKNDSYCEDIDNITLNYTSNDVIASGNGFTAYFCCYPFELNNVGDSFKVTVTTTAGEVFEKEIELTSETLSKLGGKFAFAQSRATKFTIDMGEAILVSEASVTTDEGTKYYSTIAAAFAAANEATSAATITLMKDCTASAALTVSKDNADITLDLNGCTLTETDENSTNNRLDISKASAKLTITDETGNGKVIQSANKNTISISSGTLVIKGGSIEQSSNITSNLAHISVSGTASLTVEGGKISATKNSISFSSSGILSIKDGEITSSSSNAVYLNGDNSNAEISGGKFKGSSNDINVSKGTMSISGGYFSKEVLPSYLADSKSCYQTNEHEGYPYSVLTTGVALFRQGTDKVESKTSINEAITAANNATGECTITLVDNCQVSGPSAVNVTNSAGVTLDLNGKTLNLTSEAYLRVSEGGKMIIDDNDKENLGVVTTDGYNYAIVAIKGDLTIKGGTIESTMNSSSVVAAVGSTNDNLTNITIKGGKLTASSGSGRGLYVNNPKCTVLVEGDGQISSSVSFAFEMRSGKATVSGGEISSSAGHAIYLNGTANKLDLKITGGKIITTGGDSKYALCANATASGSSIEINGGDFRSSDCVVYSAKANQAKIIVKKDDALSNAIPYFYTYKTQIFARQPQDDDANKTNSNVVSYGYFGASGQLTVNATATLTGCKKDDVDVTGPDNLKYTKYYHMD